MLLKDRLFWITLSVLMALLLPLTVFADNVSNTVILPDQEKVETSEVSDSVATETDDTQAVGLQQAEFKFFSADYSTFRYSDNNIQLEIYALIDRSFLGTESSGIGVTARYQITFRVFSGDSLLTGDTWVRTDHSDDPSTRKEGQKIPELMKYMVIPGNYKIDIEVIDLVKRVSHMDVINVEAKSYDEEKLGISDIIFASQVQKSDEKTSEFFHNGLLVIPNAERIFGLNNPLIYYYVEIYNLSDTPGAQHEIKREIFDDQRQVVKELRAKTRDSIAKNVVDYGYFNINEFYTGTYKLVITVTDLVTSEVSTHERTFWVYRPDKGDPKPLIALADPGFNINEMTDEDIEQEIAYARYLMTSKIIKAMRSMDANAKRHFLAKWWITNDPDKDTPNNELRDEYLRRVREANSRWGTLNQEGWATDRGRVFILYGEPDQIEDHSFDVEASKSYYVWHYDSIEGGVIFVFVDRANNGIFTQVHSNKNGELYNTSWYETEVRGY